MVDDPRGHFLVEESYFSAVLSPTQLDVVGQ